MNVTNDYVKLDPDGNVLFKMNLLWDKSGKCLQ